MSGAREHTRIDKWLWAARFFKTRALALKACELGRVRSNGALAKASREVRVGDRLNVTNESGLFEIEVLVLSEVRGPASVAQGLYRESEQSRAARALLAEEKKAAGSFDFEYGRPSKKDRREMKKAKGRIIRFGSEG